MAVSRGSIGAVLLVLVTVGGGPVDAAGWTAGMARVSITPPEPVWLAGYAARSGPADGVLTDLNARALVLEADGGRLAVVTLDLIEIPAPLHERIVAIARDRHGLAARELLVNCSHTHGGPMVSARTVAEWGLDPVWGRRAESYVDHLLARIDEVLGAALAKRLPVTVAHGTARCGFAINRRLPTPDGIRLAPNPDGPVDHDVPVLRVTDDAGALCAVVFGYACHATALGPTARVNGDYVGFALERLEADHPGAVALFLAGCGGDQDPAPRRDEHDARQHGLALAGAVERVVSADLPGLAPRLGVGLETCPLAFAPLPPRDELGVRAASPDGFVARHAAWVLAAWPEAGDRPPDHPLPVQVAVFGGTLTLVALGGEPVVDYATRVKAELAAPGGSVWVAGYSNFVHAYVPSRRVLAEGGYEGTGAVIYQSLPGPFAADVEDRIMAAVHRQAAALRSPPAAP